MTVVALSVERIAAWNGANLSRLPVYEPGLDAVVGQGLLEVILWAPAPWLSSPAA